MHERATVPAQPSPAQPDDQGRHHHPLLLLLRAACLAFEDVPTRGLTLPGQGRRGGGAAEGRIGEARRGEARGPKAANSERVGNSSAVGSEEEGDGDGESGQGHVVVWVHAPEACPCLPPAEPHSRWVRGHRSLRTALEAGRCVSLRQPVPSSFALFPM